SDGSTMMGTYNSTAGTAADGSVCGYAETGLSWSAISVPPLTGSIQGSFHSTEGAALLNDQDFIVSGSLTQGQNIGASNATITGTLSFINPATNLSDYPCFSLASVNGQISGNSVILQIIGTNGSVVGQIGEPAGSQTGVNPVTFDSAQGGYILHGAKPTYMVATSSCGGNLSSASGAGDAGNICLALNGGSACQQPVTLSPAALTFPGQLLGSALTTQTLTLTNSSSSALNGLTLGFTNNADNQFGSNTTDFNGVPSFTETDACGAGGGPSNSSPFNLASGQSCSITLNFAPQQSCPWLPFPGSGNPQSISGASPQYCPFPQSATVTVNCPASVNSSPTPCYPSADGDPLFAVAVPIKGIGLSAIQLSTPELDFGAEEQFTPPESSLPQTLSFTNNGVNPVQILGRAPCTNQSTNSHKTLPSPRSLDSPIAGLQVVSNDVYQITPDPTTPATIFYRCDSDSDSALPNFQISSDSCTGALLAPQASCSVQVSYVPQPKTNIGSNGLDYFLELNTVQCYGSQTSQCEIDSGRFPVELKSNGPSPLRMSPSASLDFGNQKKGTTSAPLTITLLNDPNLTNPPNPQCTALLDCASTVTFVGNIVVNGNYSETDDCPATLAPSDSCTLTVTFNPGSAGYQPGTLTLNYTQQPSSGSVTTGNPQFVYLRGTGQ
ncbi:MAG: choice-of-anchor D domain-containing protein, partial [Terriglobales bacterium]